MKKWFILIAILLASLALVACEPEVKEVIVTQVVEKEVVVTEIVEVGGQQTVVEVTKIVEQIVEVTPVPKAEGPKVGGPGDVYRMAVLSDMTTLNIWAAYDPDASIWNYAVYGSFWPTAYGLTDHRWDFIPSLAADMPSDLEQEGDFWVCTVPLRQDAMWSDGAPITANDYAWTAETVLFFDLSGNWENYDGAFLDHIEAVDDYTAKLYYHTKPGLSRHQYGVLQAPILNSAFWQPLVQPLLDQMAEIKDLDPESEDYIAKREELVQALYQLELNWRAGWGVVAVQPMGARCVL